MALSLRHFHILGKKGTEQATSMEMAASPDEERVAKGEGSHLDNSLLSPRPAFDRRQCSLVATYAGRDGVERGHRVKAHTFAGAAVVEDKPRTARASRLSGTTLTA